MEQRTTQRLGALRIPGEPVDRFAFDTITTRRRPELAAVLAAIGLLLRFGLHVGPQAHQRLGLAHRQPNRARAPAARHGPHEGVVGGPCGQRVTLRLRRRFGFGFRLPPPELGQLLLDAGDHLVELRGPRL